MWNRQYEHFCNHNLSMPHSLRAKSTRVVNSTTTGNQGRFLPVSLNQATPRLNSLNLGFCGGIFVLAVVEAHVEDGFESDEDGQQGGR